MYREIPLDDEFIDRFHRRYEKRGPNECWPWLLTPDPDGYGNLSYEGKSYRAHRVALAIDGRLTTKDDARHVVCDNPICVNPAHLAPGTKQQNRQDCMDRGRQAKRESHGRSKLTWALVDEIRERAAKGESFGSLAREFGVTRANVSDIVHFLTWKRDGDVEIPKRKKGKINRKIADSVRERVEAGEPQVKLARELDISTSTISLIMLGKIWAA